jgi:hypothetical protein
MNRRGGITLRCIPFVLLLLPAVRQRSRLPAPSARQAYHDPNPNSISLTLNPVAPHPSAF